MDVGDQSPPEIALVAALARNRVIGVSGQLPWRLRDDLRRFKRLTMGHTLLVGRKTYESMGALPGRRTVVLSRAAEQRRDRDDAAVTWRRTLAGALEHCRGLDLVFCCGGAEIYSLCLPLAGRMHLTWVEAEVDGDTRFPEVEWDDWRLVSEEAVPADERNEFPTSYCVYARVDVGASADAPHRELAADSS